MQEFSFTYLVTGFALTVSAAFSMGVAQAQEPVDIVLFYGQGCPHCAQMEAFLQDLKSEYPLLMVHGYEVYSSDEGRQMFERMAQAYGVEIQGVPTVFLSNEVLVGFSAANTQHIREIVRACMQEVCESPLAKIPAQPSRVEDAASETPSGGNGDLPVPHDYAQALTIPAVVSAAAVDAINPCAFAVLIILITTVLASGKRRRALYAGLAFSVSIFISYYLMGIGLYSAIQFSGFTHVLYKTIAVLAVVIGLFNLKDYIWYGKWFVMEVPMSWRPNLKALLRGVTSVPGAFGIGFLVSLFLLPCTSGPYIVILGLLAKTTTRTHAMALLVLYNLIFVLPMVLITGAVYVGLTTVEQAEAWRTKQLRTLHLIAGVILLVLGVGMLLSIQFGWM